MSSLSHDIGLESLYIADQFAFIPTASAICYKYGDALTYSDYNQDFYQNTPSYPNQTPFSALKMTSVRGEHAFGSCSSNDISWIVSHGSKQISGSVSPQDGDIYVVTNCQEPITWSTSDTEVATIDQSGRICIISSGFVTIYASISNGNSGITLSKRIMVGFPDFTLSKREMSIRLS